MDDTKNENNIIIYNKRMCESTVFKFFPLIYVQHYACEVGSSNLSERFEKCATILQVITNWLL